MNFVLTNEKIQERIINKANSGNLKFEKFELDYLKENKEFLIHLLKQLGNSDIPVEEYGFIEEILYDNIILAEEIIYSPALKNILFKYCLYGLKVEKYLIEDKIFEIFDDNQKEMLLNEIITSIQNNATFYNLTSYYLDMIIKTDKYELLNDIKYNCDFRLNSYQKSKLKEYYSLDKEIPGCLISVYADLEFSKTQIPLDKLLKIYKSKTTHSSYDFDEDDIAIDDITTDDIKNKINSVNRIPDNANIYIYDIANMFNLSVADAINFLLDKGYIDNIFIGLNEEKYIELKDKIITTIKNGAKVSFVPSFMQKDIDFMTALLETNQVDKLISFLTNDDHRGIDYLLENNINNFKDKFLDLIEKDSSHSIYYCESEVAKKILFQAIYDGRKIIIVDDTDDINMFYNTLIENKKFDELYFQMNENEKFSISRLSDKAMEVIKNEIKHNSEFVEKFFLNHLNNPFIKEMIMNDSELKQYFLNYSEFSLNKIMDNINHQEENENNYTKEMYDTIKDYYVSKYGLNNPKHLDYLAEHFGYLILRYIDSENIINLINLPDDKFNKIVNLFKETEFTQTNAETIFDSIIQDKFRKKNPDIIDIFPNIMHSIADKDSKYIELIAEIIKNLDDNFFKKYPQFNEIKGHEKEFMVNLIARIGGNNPLEEENAINILHIFTNYYIASQREKYASKFDIRKELLIPYEYDEKDLAKTYGKYVVLPNYANKIIRELIDKYEIDYDLSRDIISYYQGVYNFSPEREKDIRPNIKYLVKVLDEFIKKNFSYRQMEQEMAWSHPSYLDNVKIKYIYDRTDKKNLTLLSKLNVNAISNKLLDGEHEKAYESLLATMQKYRLHLLPRYLNDYLVLNDIIFHTESLTELIENYYKIYEIEKKKLEFQGKVPDKVLFSGINAIKTATIYASNSSVYSILFGEEDARLIKSNPKPNESPYTSKERLSTSVDYMIKNYQRDKVCIPTFNEEISFSSDNGHSKKMRVIVGNFTNPCNLTHGERTGACMRIGGAARNLYDFCLSNKCGFHIRFEDENGKYISRVSGFRNGNTIFLNQLRCSCDKEEYSDSEVVSACKEASKKIIEMAKDSGYPIDNVVVDVEYAMKSVPDESIYLNIAYGEHQKGFDSHFHSDYSNKAIVLASTGKPFVPIKFETQNLPEYLPARDIPYKGKSDDKLIEMINRVHSVKEVLDGKDYREVEKIIPLDEKILYGIANNDYYVYVNANGEVHTLLIDNDKRAIAEFEQAKEEVAAYMIDNNIFMENESQLSEENGRSK